MDPYTGRSRADRRKLRRERRAKRKAQAIANGGSLGSQAPQVVRHQVTDQPGQTIDGGLSVGGDNTIYAAAAVSTDVAEDGGGPADPGRYYRGLFNFGEPWMGLEPGQIICDVERVEEGVLIAIDALERVVDHLAIMRQSAQDACQL